MKYEIQNNDNGILGQTISFVPECQILSNFYNSLTYANLLTVLNSIKNSHGCGFNNNGFIFSSEMDDFERIESNIKLNEICIYDNLVGEFNFDYDEFLNILIDFVTFLLKSIDGEKRNNLEMKLSEILNP